MRRVGVRVRVDRHAIVCMHISARAQNYLLACLQAHQYT
jgi:hypothetical protein